MRRRRGGREVRKYGEGSGKDVCSCWGFGDEAGIGSRGRNGGELVLLEWIW